MNIQVNNNLVIRENDDSVDLIADAKHFAFIYEEDRGYLRLKKETASTLIILLKELLDE